MSRPIKLDLVSVCAVLMVVVVVASHAVHGQVVLKPDQCQFRNDTDCEKCKICKNGALCSIDDTKADVKCYCDAGYTGRYCQIHVNECLSLPCANNATCVDLISTYKCECLVGYTGMNCEVNIDECERVPCGVHGKCTDLVNDYACECHTGFYGRNCEHMRNECDTLRPCMNNGKCVYDPMATDGYTCLCDHTGYTGPHCQFKINYCLNQTCMFNGDCSNGLNSYKCKCFKGYEGVDCESKIDYCATGNNQCHPNTTAHCWQNFNKTVGSYRNYTQYDEPYVCECSAGFRGKYCDVDVDECDEQPCGPHGKCINLINAYRCECMPGFTGQRCLTNVNECTTHANLCNMNATCIDLDPSTNDLAMGYECDCRGLVDAHLYSYAGQNCTIRLDMCQNGSMCENNSTCVAYYDNRRQMQAVRCMCPPGYTGPVCNKSTTIRLDSTYSLKYDANVVDVDVYHLAFEFKLNADLKRTPIPLVYVKFDAYASVELVVNRYFIDVYLNRRKYKQSLAFINDNQDVPTKWHHMDIYMRMNFLEIVYSYDNYRFNGSLKVVLDTNGTRQMPILNHFAIGEYYAANQAGKYIDACIRDLMLNNVHLFVDDSSVKYGCESPTTTTTTTTTACTMQCENNSKCQQTLYNYECVNCKPPNYGKHCHLKHDQIDFNQTNSNLYINLSDSDHADVFDMKFKFLIRQFNSNWNQIGFLTMKSNDNGKQLALNLIKISQNEYLVDFVYQSSATDSIYLKNLFKKQLNFYDFHKFYVLIDYKAGNLKIYLNETNYYQINDLILPVNKFTNIQIHSAFNGYLTEFYLNDEYIANLATNKENRFTSSPTNQHRLAIVEQTTCLFDRCDDCNEIISKCPSRSTQTNQTYLFRLKDEYALKAIQYSINVTELGRMKIDDNPLSLLTFGQYGVDFFEFQIVNQTSLKLNNKQISLDRFVDMLNIKINMYNANYIDVQLNMAWTTRLYLNVILKSHENYELSVKNRYCLVNDIYVQVSDAKVYLNDKQFYNKTYFKYFTDFKVLNRPKCHSNAKYMSKTGQTNVQSSISNKQLYSCDLYKLCGSDKRFACKNNLVYNFNEYLMSYLIMYDYKCTCPDLDQDFRYFTHTSLIANENACYYASNLYDTDTETEMGGLCAKYDGLCLNNGTCVDDQTSDTKFKCLCQENFTSKRCELNDPCSKNMCSKNSQCIGLNQTAYLCSCNPGYTGTWCNINVNDTCYKPDQCKNNGLCINRYTDDKQMPLTYECECAIGWTGQNCELKIDYCLIENLCQSNSTCVNMDTVGFRCECRPGYTGTYCELDIDECALYGADLCKHGSKCENLVGSFRCACDAYKYNYGDTCEYTHPCGGLDSPCKNNGKCRVVGDLALNQSECDCPRGFEGITCSVKNCDLIDCQHGSTCSYSISTDKYECNCTNTGFIGELCDLEIGKLNKTYFYNTLCDTNTESNNTLVKCDEQYLQIQQQIERMQQPRIPKEFLYHFIMWPLLGIMLGLLFVLMLLFVMKVRNSRSTHGTYSPSRHEQHSSRIEFNMNLKRPPEERLI